MFLCGGHWEMFCQADLHDSEKMLFLDLLYKTAAPYPLHQLSTVLVLHCLHCPNMSLLFGPSLNLLLKSRCFGFTYQCTKIVSHNILWKNLFYHASYFGGSRNVVLLKSGLYGADVNAKATWKLMFSFPGSTLCCILWTRTDTPEHYAQRKSL